MLFPYEKATHLIHTYVKCKQAAHIDNFVSTCDNENVVRQVDFSENATIMTQNEVLSAHWCHDQGTVFTAHALIDKGKIEQMF